MIKREILDLIKAKKTIQDNKKILSLARFHNGFPKEENTWFPIIPDLEKEFETLKKELKERINETEKAQETYNRITSKCNHEVRMSYYIENDFGNYMCSNCLFCDKKILDNSHEKWEESININKRYVKLFNRYYTDCDGCQDIYKEYAYIEEDVINIIYSILQNKDDDEEIDFIEEFNKLNLKYCEIENKKIRPEYYVLIIGGSNEEFINKSFYIKKFNQPTGLIFLDYFKDLLNTKVEFINNFDYIESETIKSRKQDNVKLQGYSSNKNLESILKKEKNIPFNLIINLSDLYTFNIDNNQLNAFKYHLNLKDIFPNSKIINIHSLSDNELKNINSLIKEQEYAYVKGNTFYHLEDGKVITTDFEDTCNTFRKILKK